MRRNSWEARFSDLYLDARTREGRLLDALDLKERPFDPPTRNPVELRSRNFTYGRVLEYLRGQQLRGQRQRPRKILEIGCGVGWVGARLARDLAAEVCGMDVVPGELVRARLGAGRVAPGLGLIAASVHNPPFPPNTFNVVVAIAVAQYSSSLTDFVRDCLDLCGDRGTLVVADTAFYKRNSLAAAQQRSRDYYRELGCPSMADHYYHHTLEELAELAPVSIYWPRRLGSRILRRLGRSASPFPVLAFKNQPQNDARG